MRKCNFVDTLQGTLIMNGIANIPEIVAKELIGKGAAKAVLDYSNQKKGQIRAKAKATPQPKKGKGTPKGSDKKVEGPPKCNF